MAVDVIVVGAGPVGAMLAAELRLNAAEVVVLERLEAPTGHSKAFRMQSRSLELLDQRGLFERFEQRGRKWPKAHFAGIEPLLDLGALDGRHPYALAIPQARTEEILESHARERGAEIRRGHELTGLRQDGEAVVARVRGPEGEYELTARYLVGCDGGRGAVRSLAGIGFPGTEPAVSALLGDVVLADPGQLPAGIPGTMRTEHGLLMAVSLEDGVHRLLTTEFRAPGADRDEPVTLAELRAAVRRITGVDVEMGEPRWLSRFTDTTRLAETYRSGRVFLAGDAAHVHFPIGAQGLNLGLQDAVNLGWKLAAAVAGRAAPGLLDSYDAERRPAARRVLRETRAQLALMNPDERTDPLRELFGELLTLDQVQRQLAELLTGLDARYDLSAAAGPDPHPAVGARAPELSVRTGDGAEVRVAELLRTGRGLLVDLGERTVLREVAAGWPDRVDVVAGKAPDGTVAEVLLIRPDGHLAWAAGAPTGDDAERAAGLRAALTTWFGDAAPGNR